VLPLVTSRPVAFSVLFLDSHRFHLYFLSFPTRRSSDLNMYTLFILCISFAISLLIVPLFIYIAKRFGFVDYPNYRKVHKVPMPYLGGVAILLSFTIVTLLAQPVETESKPIIIVAVVICLIGVIDDKYDLKPFIKFLGQLVAIAVPISYGIVIDTITPFVFEINFRVFSILLTVIWLAAI